VLGVVWDGAGYGPDGTVWGGEFLLITKTGWSRVGHLRPFRLPGGDAAIREPRRSAIGLLYEAFGDDAFAMTDLPPVAAFSASERKVLHGMLARGLNSPVTTSAGRVFDGFAALCGLRQCAAYEGQAAAQLEWAADGSATGRRYDFRLRRTQDVEESSIVDWEPALGAALADLRNGKPAGTISEAVHAGLAAAIVEVAVLANERRVILTGGCFQNARLTEATVGGLRAAGLEPMWHRRIPPNDGGLALGQAVWVAWAEQRGEVLCA
jgi:hydrogenase maturation protein HypF